MTESLETSSNAAQIEYWNAAAGETWARFQEALDHQIEPLGLAAMDVLNPRAGEHIIDIGCGCGQTSLVLAARVGHMGSVMGVDISKPMLEVAINRPRPASDLRVAFRQLDAQTGDLGHGIFDAAFSRFGVMFFSDPVAAFANIRASLKPGGRLVFVCWRHLRENLGCRPLCKPHCRLYRPLPRPIRQLRDRLHSLTRAVCARYWPRLDLVTCRSTRLTLKIGGADVEQTLNLALRVGPLGAALREHPELADNVADAVRDELSKYVTPNGVLMPAAVWIILAYNE